MFNIIESSIQIFQFDFIVITLYSIKKVRRDQVLMELILAYLPYAFITAYTPGPNNILAMNTVSQKGLRQGKMTLLGIAAGFSCVMLICAVGSAELAIYLPKLLVIMKYIGAAYIFWLAIHIALSKPTNDSSAQARGFSSGFFLQFANVKIYLYALTIYSGYILPYTESVTILGVSILCNIAVGVSGVFAWAVAGQILKRYMNRYYRVMNITMALVLMWSAYGLLK